MLIWTRGIGLGTLKALLEVFHVKVVTISRSVSKELAQLAEKYPDDLTVLQGDMYVDLLHNISSIRFQLLITLLPFTPVQRGLSISKPWQLHLRNTADWMLSFSTLACLSLEMLPPNSLRLRNGKLCSTSISSHFSIQYMQRCLSCEIPGVLLYS
jgi:hypothetical protein